MSRRSSKVASPAGSSPQDGEDESDVRTSVKSMTPATEERTSLRPANPVNDVSETQRVEPAVSASETESRLSSDSESSSSSESSNRSRPRDARASVFSGHDGVSELKHVPIDSAPDITNDAESGWAAVAKSIREVDQQKIEDYKDDINTILVFVSPR